jgi:hypothetical protein
MQKIVALVTPVTSSRPAGAAAQTIAMDRATTPIRRYIAEASQVSRFGELDGSAGLWSCAMTNASEPSISPAAKRMRRHRERRRDGLRCLTIQLRETEIDALIYRGMLKPEMRNSNIAIINALHGYFDIALVI